MGMLVSAPCAGLSASLVPEHPALVPEGAAGPPYVGPAIIYVPDVPWPYLPNPGLLQATVQPALLISFRQARRDSWGNVGPGYWERVQHGSRRLPRPFLFYL